MFWKFFHQCTIYPSNKLWRRSKRVMSTDTSCEILKCEIRKKIFWILMGLIYFWNGGPNSNGGFDSLWLYNYLLSLWYQDSKLYLSNKKKSRFKTQKQNKVNNFIDYTIICTTKHSYMSTYHSTQVSSAQMLIIFKNKSISKHS